MIRVLLLVMALSLTANAQTAQVIQLSSEDAREARDLDLQLQTLQKKIATHNDSIRKKYLTESAEKREQEGGGSYIISDPIDSNYIFVNSYSVWCIDTNCPPTKSVPPPKKDPNHYYLKAWGSGAFEFSTDYKFIVPLQSLPYYPSTNSSCYGPFYNLPVSK